MDGIGLIIPLSFVSVSCLQNDVRSRLQYHLNLVDFRGAILKLRQSLPESPNLLSSHDQLRIVVFLERELLIQLGLSHESVLSIDFLPGQNASDSRLDLDQVEQVEILGLLEGPVDDFVGCSFGSALNLGRTEAVLFMSILVRLAACKSHIL